MTAAHLTEQARAHSLLRDAKLLGDLALRPALEEVENDDFALRRRQALLHDLPDSVGEALELRGVVPPVIALSGGFEVQPRGLGERVELLRRDGDLPMEVIEAGGHGRWTPVHNPTVTLPTARPLRGAESNRSGPMWL